MMEIFIKLLKIKSSGEPLTTVKCVLSLKNLKECLKPELLRKFVHFLTIDETAEIKLFNGPVEIYRHLTTVGDQLIMPRFLFQKIVSFCLENEIQHNISHLSHVPITELRTISDRKFGKMKIDVYPDKQKVITMIIDTLKSEHGLIAKLDTGKGKSVIIAEIIRQTELLTHVVTKDCTLQRQMFEDLHHTLELDIHGASHCFDEEGKLKCISKTGSSSCKYIALLGGTKNKNNTVLLNSGTYKVLISVINSAKNKTCDYYSKFGLTIFDECHNYTSAENSKIFQHAQTHYMLGLSATPNERWNSLMLEHNIGKMIDYDPYIVSKNRGNGIVYKVVYDGPPEYTKTLKNKNGIMSVAKMVEQFMYDEERNRLIIDLIIQATNAVNAQISNTDWCCGFVFAMRNDFLVHLKNLLDEECKTRGIAIRSEVLCSGINGDTREAIKNTAHVIFTNYAFREGVNIKRSRFEILASPYKNKGKQITGRVLRENLEEVRYFYDIIDNKTPLRSQFTERKLMYEERGFKIENLKL
jgi:superfamily II DNA or RNA helicase